MRAVTAGKQPSGTRARRQVGPIAMSQVGGGGAAAPSMGVLLSLGKNQEECERDSHPGPT